MADWMIVGFIVMGIGALIIYTRYRLSKPVAQ